MPAPDAVFEVAIIGGGFSGIAMGIALRQAGITSFVILEAADRVGGTWRDNVYPGCQCDVPSHLYSYSFELNPHWSRDYGEQQEILAYIEACTDKYAVREHVRFGANVTDATFDDERGTWELVTAKGDRFVARVVVGAVGPFGHPSIPNIPGRESFAGQTLHSARWDGSVSLAGKRVACIGTGASGIQLIPHLARTAEHLTVFQRTAAWVLDKIDDPIPAATKLRLQRWPTLLSAFRKLLYLRYDVRALAFVHEPRILRRDANLAMRKMRAAVKDPVVREALTPKYDIGCKRVLLSNDYYETFARPNVALVTSGIEKIVPEGIVTKDGRVHALDVIVFATGFDIGKRILPGKMRGAGGRDLDEAWREGCEAYLGTAMAGFPNFFMLLGPNTGLGHSSVLLMMESQVEYVLACVQRMKREGVRSLEVLPREQLRFNEWVAERISGSVWGSGCSSWYQTDKGRNIAIWPGTVTEFRAKMQRVRHEHFRASR